MKWAQSRWRAKGPWTVCRSRSGNYRYLFKRDMCVLCIHSLSFLQSFSSNWWWMANVWLSTIESQLFTTYSQTSGQTHLLNSMWIHPSFNLGNEKNIQWLNSCLNEAFKKFHYILIFHLVGDTWAGQFWCLLSCYWDAEAGHLRWSIATQSSVLSLPPLFSIQ